MKLVNPLSSFSWDTPLDIHGVPMMGVPEKQGYSFGRYGWQVGKAFGVGRDGVDILNLERRGIGRPLSAPYLRIARNDYEQRHLVPFPRYFIIEPTNICNRACTFCPIDVVDRRDARGNIVKGHMKWEHFAALMDECRQHDVYGLSLYQLGESLLWKGHNKGVSLELSDMVRHAKRWGGFRVVNVSTNGDVTNLDSMLDCDLDDLIISIDGMTADVYAENRPSTRPNDVGAFDRTVARVRAFLEKRAALSGGPFVRLQIINKGNTKDQIVDFIKYWIQVPGVGDVFVKNLDSMKPWKGDTVVSAEEDRIKAEDVGTMPCQHLWAIGSMTVSGQFNACCHDARTELTTREWNIETATFADWWRSAFMHELRGEHELAHGGGQLRSPCSTCRERDAWLG